LLNRHVLVWGQTVCVGHLVVLLLLQLGTALGNEGESTGMAKWSRGGDEVHNRRQFRYYLRSSDLCRHCRRRIRGVI